MTEIRHETVIHGRDMDDLSRKIKKENTVNTNDAKKTQDKPNKSSRTDQENMSPSQMTET